jgi:uncharacterized protein (DUF433 family)
MKDTISQHIENKPEVCGGRPCITGTRVRVQDTFVWNELEGISPDEIVSRFPQLTLADVHAALADYWDSREERQRQIQEDDDLVAEVKQQTLSKLAKRLIARGDADAAISPR